MQLKPLHDFVLLKRKKSEEKTIGGLFLPQTGMEDSLEAEVLAVGNGRMLEDGKIVPLDVKVGDIVLLAPRSGTPLKLDGEDFVMVNETQILGVIEKT